MIVIQSNKMSERTALGIKAYYANQKFLKSRLVTKCLKLKLYRTVIFSEIKI